LPISGATTCGSRNPLRRTLIALSSDAARKFLSIVLPIIRTIGTLPGRIRAIRHQIISVTLQAVQAVAACEKAASAATVRERMAAHATGSCCFN